MSRLDPIKEAQAAAALKESLRQLGEGDDDALLIDSIEGETDFMEAVDRILGQINEDHALVAAVDIEISNLRARKERFKKRAEVNKTLIEHAFIVAELPKVERPLGTLFLSNRAPKVIIETESDIPAKYWKAGDPVLDQKALLADLKARREAIDTLPDDKDARQAALADLPPEIPGATLSNGSRSLSIRTA